MHIFLNFLDIFWEHIDQGKLFCFINFQFANAEFGANTFQS